MAYMETTLTGRGLLQTAKLSTTCARDNSASYLITGYLSEGPVGLEDLIFRFVLQAKQDGSIYDDSDLFYSLHVWYGTVSGPSAEVYCSEPYKFGYDDCIDVCEALYPEDKSETDELFDALNMIYSDFLKNNPKDKSCCKYVNDWFHRILIKK